MNRNSARYEKSRPCIVSNLFRSTVFGLKRLRIDIDFDHENHAQSVGLNIKGGRHSIRHTEFAPISTCCGFGAHLHLAIG
jgi:hypothetical protein